MNNVGVAIVEERMVSRFRFLSDQLDERVQPTDEIRLDLFLEADCELERTESRKHIYHATRHSR